MPATGGSFGWSWQKMYTQVTCHAQHRCAFATDAIWHTLSGCYGSGREPVDRLKTCMLFDALDVRFVELYATQ